MVEIDFSKLSSQDSAKYFKFSSCISISLSDMVIATSPSIFLASSTDILLVLNGSLFTDIFYHNWLGEIKWFKSLLYGR